MKERRFTNPLRNENGIALAMVLILAAITLAVMAALVYMLTASTQISGMQKRYKTSLEAARGGADIVYKAIAARGMPSLPGLPSFKIPLTAKTSGAWDCFAWKLNASTNNWPAICTDGKVSIDPKNADSYDMFFDIGTTATYRVYSKITSTVEGNSGADMGLSKGSVVSSNPGEIVPMSMPYLYTIEVEAENRDDPRERGKYSILYQY